MSKAVFTAKDPVPAQSFQAVSIRSTLCACDAVQALEGKRYLAREAPSIPVTGCSRPQKCSCRYMHLDDRRQEDRRESVHGIADQYVTIDRRSGSDRRRPKQSES